MTYSNFEPSGSDGTSNLHTIEPHAAAQNRALSPLKARGLAVDFDRKIFNNVAAPARRRPTLRGLGYAGRAIIIMYIGLDAIIFPMFRPSSRWLGGRAFVHAAQRRVGRLPAYVILALLALPFAIAEPAKILAVYLMATGHAFIGTLVLAGAYFISLVIVERLFRGGRAKLLTIPWFKKMAVVDGPSRGLTQTRTLDPPLDDFRQEQGSRAQACARGAVQTLWTWWGWEVGLGCGELIERYNVSRRL